MQLDTVSVSLRPRNAWEAMDLGFSMVRVWWKPLYVAWIVGVLPVAIVVSLLCGSMPWLAALIMWWLKPLFDRVPLFILSRATFGAMPTGRETARAVLGLWRKSFLWDLTLGRFDPARSFDMSVRDLEGLRGKARRQRLRVLQKRTRSHAVWLTIVCIHLELVLSFSLLAMVYLFLPQTVQAGFLAMLLAPDEGFWISILQNSTYWIAITVLEPFYVAAGFALYLNRRTLLEGWDVEIAFRRIAQRARTSLSSARAATLPLSAVAAVLLLGGLFLPSPSGAVTSDRPSAYQPRASVDRVELKQDISAVLKQPDFQTQTWTTHWKYVGKPDTHIDASPEWAWLDKLHAWMPGVARVLEGLLWLVAAWVVIWLVVRRERWLGLLGVRRSLPAMVPAKTLFGLDIQPESLPDHLAEEAWRLWQNGQQRAALSLLYRGALADLVSHQKIELGVQATEGDCMRLCRASTPQETGDYFGKLTRAWQSVAYAGRHPGAAEMQQLCQLWPNYFSLNR